MLEDLISEELPGLRSMLENLGTTRTISPSWFLTVYLNVLRSYTIAVSVMDLFICDGARVLFQLALIVLYKQQSLLKACRDEGEAMMSLNAFFDSVIHTDEEVDMVKRNSILTLSQTSLSRLLKFLSISDYKPFFHRQNVPSHN